MHQHYDGLVSRIVAWASGESEIRAVAMVGSPTRTDLEPDLWSDLDLVLFVGDPDRYCRDRTWLDQIRAHTVSFVEEPAVGDGKEVRVLFEGFRDVDFIFTAAADISRITQDPIEADILSRGCHLLSDKDGDFTPALTSISPEARLTIALPGKEAFLNLVSDFHYHLVWVAKKLARGETLVAQECLDGYLRRLYVQCCAWESAGRGDDPQPVIRLCLIFSHRDHCCRRPRDGVSRRHGEENPQWNHGGHRRGTAQGAFSRRCARSFWADGTKVSVTRAGASCTVENRF